MKLGTVCTGVAYLMNNLTGAFSFRVRYVVVSRVFDRRKVEKEKMETCLAGCLAGCEGERMVSGQ